MAFQRRKSAAFGVKAHVLGFVEPALASPIEKVPSGERWIHEIKFDGYRIQLHIANPCRIGQRETLPIAGFVLKEKKFDGIYLGRRKGDNLIYAGKVDHGFDIALAKELQARLRPLIRKTQPYAKKIAHRAIWLEPSLLAEIEYRTKSAEGKLRRPFFEAIREDM
jgi:ATP-dependent DNA ligase